MVTGSLSLTHTHLYTHTHTHTHSHTYTHTHMHSHTHTHTHTLTHTHTHIHTSDNFEMTSDDELTLRGFLDLHMMAVRDEEGGEGEVWEVFTALGYNRHLQLDQVKPLHKYIL